MALVTYTREDDILYVRLRDELRVDHSVCVDDLRIIDYTPDNAVIGFEFIGASGGVDLRDLPFAHRVEQLIGESGYQLPLFA